jgi:hypothetical protein
MDSLSDFSKPALYEFRVRGRISSSAPWFRGMHLTVDETTVPPQTILRGGVVDQAALYGLINRIRDLGLTLLSVKRVEQKEEGDEADRFEPSK